MRSDTPSGRMSFPRQYVLPHPLIPAFPHPRSQGYTSY